MMKTSTSPTITLAWLRKTFLKDPQTINFTEFQRISKNSRNCKELVYSLYVLYICHIIPYTRAFRPSQGASTASNQLAKSQKK